VRSGKVLGNSLFLEVFVRSSEGLAAVIVEHGNAGVSSAGSGSRCWRRRTSAVRYPRSQTMNAVYTRCTVD
jgi:hypothetical protein